MAEFSALANLRVQVDDASLRQADREISRGLSDPSVGGSARPDGGRDRVVELLEEQNELLEDLGDGGGGGGLGAGAAGGLAARGIGLGSLGTGGGAAIGAAALLFAASQTTDEQAEGGPGTGPLRIPGTESPGFQNIPTNAQGTPILPETGGGEDMGFPGGFGGGGLTVEQVLDMTSSIQVDLGIDSFSREVQSIVDREIRNLEERLRQQLSGGSNVPVHGVLGNRPGE